MTQALPDCLPKLNQEDIEQLTVACTLPIQGPIQRSLFQWVLHRSEHLARALDKDHRTIVVISRLAFADFGLWDHSDLPETQEGMLSERVFRIGNTTFFIPHPGGFLDRWEDGVLQGSSIYFISPADPSLATRVEVTWDIPETQHKRPDPNNRVTLNSPEGLFYDTHAQGVNLIMEVSYAGILANMYKTPKGRWFIVHKTEIVPVSRDTAFAKAVAANASAEVLQEHFDQAIEPA